jgi:hypothetical protein
MTDEYRLRYGCMKAGKAVDASFAKRRGETRHWARVGRREIHRLLCAFRDIFLLYFLAVFAVSWWLALPDTDAFLFVLM